MSATLQECNNYMTPASARRGTGSSVFGKAYVVAHLPRVYAKIRCDSGTVMQHLQSMVG